MSDKITYKPFGISAVLIEWNAIIREDILNDILLFKEKLVQEKSGLYADFIMGYTSLTILYFKEIENITKEIKALKSIYKQEMSLEKSKPFLWEIPVCYNSEFGIDLEAISVKLKRSTKEIIQLHSEKVYTVFFIGFLPGFLYLGGVNKQLFFDRKPNPRLEVPKGAVAIGGQQTGVYPSKSAGGWNIIGNTPIDFFNINNSNPCFAKAGDKIKFVPVSKNTYLEIEEKIAQNTYQISKTLHND